MCREFGLELDGAEKAKPRSFTGFGVFILS